MSFLKAEWRKLAFANYAIDPNILAPWLPFGTELDLWEGKCYVSLVGFMFQQTRVMGLKIPFHVHFEEVNLRFYVRRKEGNEWKRGVVFIQEIVPKFAITWVANTLYKEHYATMKMSHEWEQSPEHLRVKYNWKKKQNWYAFQVIADKNPVPIPIGSEAEFITEHYWGYAKAGNSKTNEYEVRHPRWLVYPVLETSIEVDFGEMYGANFAFLNRANPDSVTLAEGSPITVEGKRVITV